MNSVTGVQILDEAVRITHTAITLGKGMNPIIFLPSVSK